MLACNFAEMGNEARRMEASGADMLHLDVMDGHFVPNISFGPAVIAALRGRSGLCFDVHLMISDPLFYLERFAEAGADIVTFHLESDSDPGRTIERIKNLGMKAGLSVKPGTGVDRLLPWVPVIDLALIMTVEPGFGGQSFMADMLPKVRALRKEAERVHPSLLVEVDGGIDQKTAPLCVEAGADVLVAGSYLFGQDDAAGAVAGLKSLR